MFGNALARLKQSRDKYVFDRVAGGVLATAPLRPQGDSPLFVSMICHRDLAPYLLAIKSLYAGIGRGRIAIIDDGSLTSNDLDILHHHIPELGVFNIHAIETGPCPRGGTWERLVKIVELSADNYVIQADADVLACAPIPEVIECWRDNRPFLLGTDSGQQVSTALAAAQMVQGWIKTYHWDPLTVGVEAEASLDRLTDAGEKLYVHASSGFAGFARGVFAIAELEWFSSQMSRMLGEERWSEWGSEQIASNYMLANAPGARVLPFPRYACFEPQLKRGDHALLHFIGAHRYNDGVYRRKAADLISRCHRTL